jgi:hypothetical protein
LKRSRLQEKVDTFQKQAASVLNTVSSDGDDSWDDDSAREIHAGVEFDGVSEEENDDEHTSSAEAAEERQSFESSSSDSCIDAEHIALHLPSHLGCNWCNNNFVEDLAKAELHLRQGQLNDTLHQIRIALGQKSYIFRNDVRPARTQRLKTRAWAGVHAVESSVQHHARIYMRARQAIENLSTDNILLDRYKVLKRQDLTVKTSVIAPQVRGQRNKSLPWFWTMDIRRDNEFGAWMEDCALLICLHTLILKNTILLAVYRVHWLRAKAQKMRWIEELQCLQVEMGSAVRFFRHQEQFWIAKQNIIKTLSRPGHSAWAVRQSAMWSSMATETEFKFKALLENNPPPEFAQVVRPH